MSIEPRSGVRIDGFGPRWRQLTISERDQLELVHVEAPQAELLLA